MIYILYFKNRIRMIFRILIQLGIFKASFLCFLFILFVGIVFTLPPVSKPVIYGLLILFYHTNRKDKDFLKRITPSSTGIFQIEYALIALLFIIISLIRGHYGELIFYPIGFLLIPLNNFKKLYLPKPNFPFFQKGHYEYQRGFRSAWYFFPVAFFLGFQGIYHGNERLFYAGIILAGLICASFHTHPENVQYILRYKSSGRQIQLKLKFILWDTSLLMVPFICMSIFAGTDYLYTGLLYLTILLFIITCNWVRYFKNVFLAYAIDLFLLLPLFMLSLAEPLFIPFLALIGLILTLITKINTDKLLKHDN